MLLQSLEIQGFKGIKDLTINFNNDISVLIGENSWGSTSLLTALSIVSKENFLYECQAHDFYYGDDYCEECLSIRFTYVEQSEDAQGNIQDLSDLAGISFFSKQLRKQVVCYQLSASRDGQNITTHHAFINSHGDVIEVDEFNAKLARLIDLNPLIIFQRNAVKFLPQEPSPRMTECYRVLMDHLTDNLKELSKREVEQGLYAATLLLTHYLAGRQRQDEVVHKPTLEDWQVLDKINDLLDQIDSVIARTTMMKFFSNIIFHSMGYSLCEQSKPILVLKNFGGHMHPIITSVGMRLLKNIGIQKILTSNTSDLIPMLSLQNIMRISRFDSDIVIHQVGHKELGGNTNRKILFHIFHRRPVALFARCWFLVEGETEIWLLRELAEICGYNLSAEGIALIEFAQCGVLPLIEYANAMGIQWYVMSDGDAAGRHYAKTVRSYCGDKETYYQHMTQLPSRDIENFLFQKGFSGVYKEAAYGSAEFVNLPVYEIIQKAIQKTSKPDLAMAVCDYARVRGVRAVPYLLQKTFKKVIALSKGAVKA